MDEEDLIPFSDEDGGLYIYDDDDPCSSCSSFDYCDGWEAQYCCYRCRALSQDDCDNCDPIDI